MTPSFAASAIAALLKATLLLSAAIVLLRVLRDAAAAARHAVCILALAGAVLVLPLSFLPPALVFSVDVPVFAVSAAERPLSRAAPLLDGVAIASAAWLAGVLLFLMRYLGGLTLVRRALFTAHPVSGMDWRADLIATSAALGLRRPVALLTADVASPLSCGLLRPVVVIPLGAAAWQQPRRRAVLLHELAHVLRRDLWMNAIAALAAIALWFHPLAWMLARRMRREQEFACDDVVLNHGVAPSSYAGLLLESAKGAKTDELFACAMTGRGEVKSRLAHVLDAARCRATRRVVMARASAAVLVAVLGLGLLHPISAEEVHKIGGDVRAPKLVSKVEPQYTEAARNAKIEGTVILDVVIGARGRVDSSEIVQSLEPGLDNNAIAAVELWAFEPATKKGEPVAVRAKIEINFRLQ